MSIQRSGWLIAAYCERSPDTIQVLGFMHHNTGEEKIQRATEILWRSNYLDAVELVTEGFSPYKPQWGERECWIGPNDFVVATWRIKELAFSEDQTECTFIQVRSRLGDLKRTCSVVPRLRD